MQDTLGSASVGLRLQAVMPVGRALPAGNSGQGDAAQAPLTSATREKIEDERRAAQATEAALAAVSKDQPFLMAGPPPAFEANVLELESDLRMQLARLAAERLHSGHDRPDGVPQPGGAPPDAVAGVPGAAPAAGEGRQAADGRGDHGQGPDRRAAEPDGPGPEPMTAAEGGALTLAGVATPYGKTRALPERPEPPP